MKTVMVTGHRPQRLQGQEKEISKWFNDKIKELNPSVAVSGMAAGADQIWAMAVLDNYIPLECYIPYKRQFYHPQEEYITGRASAIKFICEEFSKESYTIRDKAMVDNSDIVLAVWDGVKTGGTWNTIKYAREQGKEIYFYDGFGEVNI